MTDVTKRPIRMLFIGLVCGALGLLAGWFLRGAATGGCEWTGGPFYESLDLASPEAAVDTFIGAFDREDWVTVHVVLSARAQHEWYSNLMRLFDDRLVKRDKGRLVLKEVGETTRDLYGGEHSAGNADFLFSVLMSTAVKHDALLIDLRGGVTRTSRKETTIDRVPVVEIGVEAKRAGALTIRLVQAPSGRWRVLQVMEPGGDDTWLPWSVKWE